MSFFTEFPLRSFEFRLNFIYARTWEATQNTFYYPFLCISNCLTSRIHCIMGISIYIYMRICMRMPESVHVHIRKNKNNNNINNNIYKKMCCRHCNYMILSIGNLCYDRIKIKVQKYKNKKKSKKKKEKKNYRKKFNTRVQTKSWMHCTIAQISRNSFIRFENMDEFQKTHIHIHSQSHVVGYMGCGNYTILMYLTLTHSLVVSLSINAS